MSWRRFLFRRKMLFVALTICLSVILVEGIAYCCLCLARRDFSMSELTEIRAILEFGTSLTDGGNEVIHPYVGWIHNPEVSPPEQIHGRSVSVNRLGFRDDGESVYKKGGPEFLLGIAGGSVAAQFSWDAETLIRQTLADHPRLAGRPVRIIRMATPGYKQPQQLMVLNYLLALGGEFDAIINLDGFNETSLTIQENVVSQTAMAYPRAWQSRTLTVMDPRTSEAAFRLLELRQRRQRMARQLNASRFHWSPTLNLIWLFRDQNAVNELAALALEVHHQRRTSFLNHGPDESFQSHQDMLQQVVELWQRCSLQMHHLCRANDIEYLHVLQPNQYVPESKPLSVLEYERAYAENEGTCEVIVEAYPLLQDAGLQLKADGVAFSDQSMVFREVEETLYVDPWCHFNQRGNEILAAAILADLKPLLDASTAATDKSAH